MNASPPPPMWIVARPAVEPISLAPGAKKKYPFHLEVAGCADALAAKAKNIPKMYPNLFMGKSPCYLHRVSYARRPHQQNYEIFLIRSHEIVRFKFEIFRVDSGLFYAYTSRSTPNSDFKTAVTLKVGRSANKTLELPCWNSPRSRKAQTAYCIRRRPLGAEKCVLLLIWIQIRLVWRRLKNRLFRYTGTARQPRQLPVAGLSKRGAHRETVLADLRMRESDSGIMRHGRWPVAAAMYCGFHFCRSIVPGRKSLSRHRDWRAQLQCRSNRFGHSCQFLPHICERQARRSAPQCLKRPQ